MEIEIQSPKYFAKASKTYFATHYLGLDYVEHQRQWLDEVLFKHELELDLAPRDHGKTTTIPRVGILHQTLYNPGFNCLLLSKTLDQSKKTLDLIYNDLENNERLQEDFGYELQDLRRTGNQVWYNLKDSDKELRDGTIEATGILGNITGAHFQHIYMDDIFDDENCRTPHRRKTLMDQINGTILPLLEPGCGLTAIGTRKHFDDGYKTMITNPAWFVNSEKAILKWPESYEYVYDEQGVITDVINIKGDYKVLWPEKWNIKELLKKKAQMGSLIFRREYQNETEQLKGKVFKSEWLQHYAILEENAERDIPYHPPLSEMDIYQGIDLAISQSETADYFVISTVGVTKNPYRKWLLDWYRDKIPFPKQVKIVPKNFYHAINPIWKNEAWDVLQIGIESNAYQLALAQDVISNWGLPVKEIRNYGNKTLRITAGAVDYENGVWMIPIDHPGYEDFFNEYAEFDEGEHDDILDSMEIASTVIRKPGKKRIAHPRRVKI